MMPKAAKRRDATGGDTSGGGAQDERAADASCPGCRQDAFDRRSFKRKLAMAFQPIVDVAARRVFAYEALVRGPAGEPAAAVIGTVGPAEWYGFDQACRVAAIETAASLGLAAREGALAINFLPNAVDEPRACIRTTLQAAARSDFPTGRLIFEINEGEIFADPGHLAQIVAEYAAMGSRTAIDDFGAGHSNLNLLTRFRPDLIKLDIELVRGIDGDCRRRRIVGHMAALCRELGIEVIAEGIETPGECAALRDLGITLMQGFLFAAPALGALPGPSWPG